jgi:translocation and assembly module TamA
VRLYGRATGYWPLAHEWFSQARLELGQILVRGNVEMPDTQQWRAGGEGSVRGYEWRSLAPVSHFQQIVDGQPILQPQVVGGNSLITTSIEVAHVITQKIPSLWWAAFIDSGNATDRFDNLAMATGYGLGIRWRSPVGPLSVDWSFGDVSKGAREWGRIDLSVGIVF